MVSMRSLMLWTLLGSHALAAAPAVEDLAAGFEQARGGAEAWRDLQTLVISGTMQMDDLQSPMLLEFQRPDRVRLQFQVQGMTVVQAYDGEHGWSVAPFVEEGLPTLMFGDELAEMREMADFAGALADHKRKGNQLSLDGEEAVAGVPSWRIKVTKANGGAELWWLAKDSLLALRTASKRVSSGQQIGVASVLADYREVGGLLFPFSVTNTIQRDGAVLEQVIIIDQIKLNPTIDNQRFRFPR